MVTIVTIRLEMVSCIKRGKIQEKCGWKDLHLLRYWLPSAIPGTGSEQLVFVTPGNTWWRMLARDQENVQECLSNVPRI
jgi:hypothetical protein